MDKIIEKTIEMAHEMMKDPRFLAFRLATERNDEDEELQKLIGDFNVARMKLNQAARDENGKEKADAIQQEVKELYAKIMQSETMTNYVCAQEEMNKVVKKVNAIITGTLDGMLPEDIDLDSACSGDCSSCGGCHE